MYFVYEMVIYYQAIVRLSQLLSNPHLRHISVLCVSARPCGTHAEENSFPLPYNIKLMTIKLCKIHFYGSENVVSSSGEHCVQFMKVNVFSLFFLIGQTSFLMGSNIKNAKSFLVSIVNQNSKESKILRSWSCLNTRSSIIDFNTINRI